MCKVTLARGSAAGAPTTRHAERPPACLPRMLMGTLRTPLGLSLFTSEMGTTQHVIYRVVSGPSKNTEDAEWLCKLSSSLLGLKAGMIVPRLKASHPGGQWLGVSIYE